MNIFYCVRSLDGIPSCIYNIQLINELGFRCVPVLGSSSQELLLELEKDNIEYHIMLDNASGIERGGFFYRLSKNIRYRKFVRDIVHCEADENSQIFLGTGDTAIALYGLLTKYKKILVLKEMYEVPRYYKALLKIMSNKMDGVVCCEVNRSRLIKCRWRLSKMPYTIPNKPTHHPRVTKMQPSTDSNRDAIEAIKDSKVILYQARHIHFVPELEKLALALNILQREYILVLVGTVDNNKEIEKVLQIYPNTYMTGHIKSPHHLELTSYAYIGVAVYQENSLNNLFCAPNKIYEYAGFGIPTLGNDIPGLVETIQVQGAGECANWSDPSDIARAIQRIENNYEKYSNNAKKMYYETDCSEIMKQIITDIGAD